MRNLTALKKMHLVKRQQQSGFTMIEILIVVILIAVLSAIAAPGWLAFVNRQRVSAAHKIVVQSLEKAQSEAKTRKLKYTVSVQVASSSGKLVPQIAVHRYGSTPSGGQWENLGNPGEILLGSNIDTTKDNTTSGTTPVYLSAVTTPQKLVTFDYTGGLTTGSSTGLKIVVGTPVSNAPTTPVEYSKRCVIVTTLLGNLMAKDGSECN